MAELSTGTRRTVRESLGRIWAGFLAEEETGGKLRSSAPKRCQYHPWRKPTSAGGEEAGPVPVSYFWMHYSYLINHLEAATLLAYKAHYMVLNC